MNTDIQMSFFSTEHHEGPRKVSIAPSMKLALIGTMPRVLLACLLVCFSLTGCSQKDLINRLLSKDDDALGRQMIEALRTADYATVTKLMDPKSFDPSTTQRLKMIHGALDYGTPLEVTVIGVWSQSSVGAGGESLRKLTYQVHFPKRWSVVTIRLVQHSGTNYVQGVSVSQVLDSLNVLNRFTLANKPSLNYIFLVAAAAVPIFILFVLIICIRSPIRRKWLWVILVLLGGGVFRLDWTTGEHDCQPFSVLLLGVGAFRSSEYSPWVISVAIPAGAILFLIFRRSLMTPSKAPPATPQGSESGSAGETVNPADD